MILKTNLALAQKYSSGCLDLTKEWSVLWECSSISDKHNELFRHVRNYNYAIYLSDDQDAREKNLM